MKKLSEMTDRELAINEIFSHLDDIIERSERMTSGNFMHNKNANKLSANIIKNRIEFLLSEPHIFISSTQAEPVSEDLEKFEKEYFEKWKDEIINVYDRHAGLVDGAQWQKEQMLKDAKYVEVFDDWKYGKDADFTAQPAIKLRDSSLEIGKQVKLIIIKED